MVDAASGLDADTAMADAIAELQARVAARKQSGEYPADIDARLEVLAQTVKTRVGNPTIDPALRQLERASDIGRHRINYASRLPLGSVFHRVVARLVRRQTDGVVTQVREYAEAVDAVLLDLAQAMGGRESLASLSYRLDLALEQLAALERAGTGDRPNVRHLGARVKHLEGAVAKDDFVPWYSQDDFETAFRGSREDILASLRPLANQFAGCAPVLDFGCGRGEMLELLRDMGVEAHGVELDGALVDAVRRLGLSAEVGDGMVYLRGCADESLGGIYLGQVIEHLTVQQAMDLFASASIKLRRGGRLVVETVNNQSLYVFSHSFYVDPSHVRPVPPAYLQFLAKEAGFSGWQIDWRSPVQDGERLQPIPQTAPAEPELINRLNANIERINQTLFGPQDYALIAIR